MADGTLRRRSRRVRTHPPLPTAAEQENVRLALVFLHARIGPWACVAKIVRSKRVNLRRIRLGKRINGMRGLARRVSKIVGMDAKEVLAGRFPPKGPCRRCGHYQIGDSP
jgi:hypothetical protein